MDGQGREGFFNFEERLNRTKQENSKAFLAVREWTLKNYLAGFIRLMPEQQQIKYGDQLRDCLQNNNTKGCVDLAQELELEKKIDLDLETLRNYELWYQGSLIIEGLPNPEK
ncbi:MAG: hypothetical protein M1383_03540 [Patescibacteria group bacterium]|nr:hypothetical protein [Patescibacteria group bacterium]